MDMQTTNSEKTEIEKELPAGSFKEIKDQESLQRKTWAIKQACGWKTARN